MMLSLEMQLFCQQTQDKHGYVIIASHDHRDIGQVISDIKVGLKDRPDEHLPPVKVIGIASKSEWVRQLRSYSYMRPIPDFPYYYKVRAE